LLETRERVQAETVTRKVRIRLGEGAHAFGGATIPDDRIIVITEVEAAKLLRNRDLRHHIEVVDVFEDDDSQDAAAPGRHG
jgi:hypothetical protein